MPKKKKADHQTPKSDAVELNEEELEQAQGGGITQVPAGTSGLDLKKPQLNVKATGKGIPDLEWVPDIDTW